MRTSVGGGVEGDAENEFFGYISLERFTAVCKLAMRCFREKLLRNVAEM